MTSNRFPPYYDLCLRCREKGLDQVAEFIHELVNERELLRRDVEEANARAYVMAQEVTLLQSRAALKGDE